MRTDFDARSAAAAASAIDRRSRSKLAQAGPADLHHDRRAVGRTAACTWPMDADAERHGVEGANIRSSGTSKRSSKIASARPGGIGVAVSRHQPKASTHSSGSSPWAVATNWPSLM